MGCGDVEVLGTHGMHGCMDVRVLEYHYKRKPEGCVLNARMQWRHGCWGC